MKHAGNFSMLSVAVWSWTLSSRRINCSRWWRDCAQWIIHNALLCLTPTRCSPPPQNASQRLSPKSMPAGNSGFFKELVWLWNGLPGLFYLSGPPLASPKEDFPLQRTESHSNHGILGLNYNGSLLCERQKQSFVHDGLEPAKPSIYGLMCQRRLT